MFDCHVELECTDTFNPNRRRALIRLTLLGDDLSIEPDFFALEVYLTRGGRMDSRLTNIGQRLRGGDRLLTSLDLPDLGPADFPLKLGGKLVLRGKAEDQNLLYLPLRSLWQGCGSEMIFLGSDSGSRSCRIFKNNLTFV